jgi:hypothetical protein
VINEEWSSMDKKEQSDEQEQEPGLTRADEAIEDVGPEKEEGDAVTAGGRGGGTGGGTLAPVRRALADAGEPNSMRSSATRFAVRSKPPVPCVPGKPAAGDAGAS